MINAMVSPSARIESSPTVSVVVATYNRQDLLLRLLRQLGDQDPDARLLEVVVVDDGSTVPVEPALSAIELPFRLVPLRQTNQGAAAARDFGVTKARGEVVIIVDDDMQVGRDFVARHLQVHRRSANAVVMGRIRPDPHIGQMPLFERYNASRLDRWVAGYRAGRVQLHGNNVCTGNVSFRRSEYLAAGGFDRSLKRSEDAELGLRLEARGAQLYFSDDAQVLHGSDHHSSEEWLKSAHRYGTYDLRIGRKHRLAAFADPWRYLFALRAPIRPFLLWSILAPESAGLFTRLSLAASERLDALGFDRLAMHGTSLIYGMEYFRGVRAEAASSFGALRAATEYLAKPEVGVSPDSPGPRMLSALSRALSDWDADHRVRAEYEGRYGYAGERDLGLAKELVTKIGLQLSASYRLMRMFRASNHLLAAKAVSRLIRLSFGSDIHWDADLAPGVVFIHGFGLAISHAARVGPGCILSQNVTLGMGRDPSTGAQGAPTLGSNIHVGPGASLMGPITIGDNSKVMAGAVVTRSIPANSVVESPVPLVRPRGAGLRSMVEET